jgi:hypothetical protein
MRKSTGEGLSKSIIHTRQTAVLENSMRGDDEVQRIPGEGFINDPKKHVLIKDMIIMVPVKAQMQSMDM